MNLLLGHPQKLLNPQKLLPSKSREKYEAISKRFMLLYKFRVMSVLRFKNAPQTNNLLESVKYCKTCLGSTSVALTT